MIIFTVTNKFTGQIFVGSTRNDLESQWEKMLAAADQNMDYPLYREIRSHGCDSFHVEEWDFTDDRSELAQLEREAMETFNAKSLKGYKTSTVKIQPKKKVRQRKSSIEKELVSLFSELSDGSESEDTPVPGSTASSTTQPAQTNQPKPQKSSRPKLAQSPSAPLPTASAIVESVFSEETPKQKQPEKPEQPAGGSQANAVVHLNNINLSDNITAQLAAIQAAADAAIAGDTSAAAAALSVAQPEAAQETELTNETLIPAAAQSTKAAEEKVEIEIKAELSPKEQKIHDAIERHRLSRSQKSSEVIATEKQQIASLLADLEAKATSLHSVTLAAAA